MIKPNQTLIFECPTISYILNNRKLVRTGVYGDGNCFFHSLLRAIDTNYRKQTNQVAHTRLVEKYRKDISDWITFDFYQSLGKGENFRIQFQQEFNDILREFYGSMDFLKEIKQDEPCDSEVLPVIFKLLTLEEIDKYIIPNVLKGSQSDNFYILFCGEASQWIGKKIKNVIPKDKLNYICGEMCGYFIELFKMTHKRIFENFKRSIKCMGTFVDSFQLECISKYSNFNFLFMNESTQKPYDGFSHIVSFDPEKPSLIFLWVNENHFEILGELENNNIINRIFSSDDPIIVGIKSLSDRNIEIMDTPLENTGTILENINRKRSKSRSRNRNSSGKINITSIM